MIRLAFLLVCVRAMISEEKPTISLPPSYFVSINDTGKIPCAVSNLAALSVFWYKVNDANHVPLSRNTTVYLQDPRLSVYFESPNKFILQIKNISTSDSGSYRCAVPLDINNQVSKDVNLFVRTAPTILANSSSSIEAVVGSNDTKLECYLEKAWPTPTLEWTRENNGLLPNGQTTYRQNVIRFTELRKEDAGIYYCNAHNEVAPVRKTFYLKVLFRPEIQAPVKRIGQALQYKAELQCIVKAYPPPMIVWLKNGSHQVDSIQPTQINTTATASDTTISTLVITAAERSQYGLYTCRAKNEFGKAEATIEFYETEKQQCAPTCGANFGYPNFKMIASTALIVLFAFRW